MQRYLLVVLGMHRSGTSALTGALAKCGAVPGTHLMPPTDDNPEGYWECAPVVRLNDELLKRLGARWDSVTALPADWTSLPAIESLRGEAAAIVAAEFGDARFAVLKDPRLCRLLPFWRDTFTEAGFALCGALTVRRPMEVAASLARRDQFAPEKSLALWFEHLVDSERASRGLPRAMISYDALLADAGGSLMRVCDNAAFPIKPTAAQRKAASDVVRPALKRQHHESPKSASRESLASGLDTVLDAGYAKLAELPAGKDPQAVVAGFAQSARAALAVAVPPWLAEELAATQGAALQRAAEVEAARSAHKARDEIEAALRARTDELALTRADLSAVRESLRAEIAAMGSSGIGTVERELRDHIARLQQELGDERATIARLAEQIDHARLGAQNQELQIENARRHIDELVGQIDLARQAHAARDEQEAAMQQNLDATHQELSTLGAEFNEIRIERDEMAGKLKTLVPEVETLRRDLAVCQRERDTLAATAKQTGEALAALTSELDRRVAAERELTADRTRLAQLEREARERISLLEGQLAEATAHARSLAQQLDAAAAKLARLDARWLGRLARRVAQA